MKRLGNVVAAILGMALAFAVLALLMFAVAQTWGFVHTLRVKIEQEDK